MAQAEAAQGGGGGGACHIDRCTSGWVGAGEGGLGSSAWHIDRMFEPHSLGWLCTWCVCGCVLGGGGGGCPAASSCNGRLQKARSSLSRSSSTHRGGGPLHLRCGTELVITTTERLLSSILLKNSPCTALKSSCQKYNNDMATWRTQCNESPNGNGRPHPLVVAIAIVWRSNCHYLHELVV